MNNFKKGDLVVTQTYGDVMFEVISSRSTFDTIVYKLLRKSPNPDGEAPWIRRRGFEIRLADQRPSIIRDSLRENLLGD